MQRLVTAGLAAGAWGVSAGLDYKPAYFAQTEDVIKVVEVARTWRTAFTNHDRVTPESGFSSLAGMAETIAMGARTGVVPVITHMKVQGHEQGRADAILAQMREATDRGVYTAADVYPYLAGQTGLVAFTIPGWAQDGGREAMLKRFADPAQRARIVKEAETAMAARFGGPSGVYLPSLKRELTDGDARVAGAGGGGGRAPARAGQSRHHRPVRDRSRSRPHPAASHRVGGVRLRRRRAAKPRTRATTGRSRACSGATCASSRR